MPGREILSDWVVRLPVYDHVSGLEINPRGIIGHHVSQLSRGEDIGMLQPGCQLVVAVEGCRPRGVTAPDDALGTQLFLGKPDRPLTPWVWKVITPLAQDVLDCRDINANVSQWGKLVERIDQLVGMVRIRKGEVTDDKV